MKKLLELEADNRMIMKNVSAPFGILLQVQERSSDQQA